MIVRSTCSLPAGGLCGLRAAGLPAAPPPPRCCLPAESASLPRLGEHGVHFWRGSHVRNAHNVSSCKTTGPPHAPLASTMRRAKASGANHCLAYTRADSLWHGQC